MHRSYLLLSAALVATLVATPGPAVGRQAGPWSIQLDATPPAYVEVGQDIVFRGKVSPGVGGTKVVLQKRYKKSKPWFTSTSVKVKANGRFQLSDSPETARPRFYRVQVKAKAGHPTTVTSAVRVKVLRWRLLTSFPVKKNNGFQLGPVRITGVEYPHSAFAEAKPEPTYRSIDFTVGPGCRRLRTFAGLDSTRSSADAMADVILGDESNEWPGYVTRTDRQTRNVKLSQGTKTVSLSTTGGSGTAWAAFGQPEVLCR